MAPPLDWNPNGNYVFDDSSFPLKHELGNTHIRHKRGGGGGKPQVADAALQYNSVEANTAAPPGKSICSYQFTCCAKFDICTKMYQVFGKN